MRRVAFPLLLIVAVVLGLAALIGHRPRTAPVQAADQSAGQTGEQPARQTAPAPPTAAKPEAAPPASPGKGAVPEGGGTPTGSQRSPARAPALAPGAVQPAVARSAGPASAAAPPAIPGLQHAAAVQASAAGDPAAGQKVFRKCQACHSLDAGKNTIGPSMAGIIGRKAGTAPGFLYSPAMKGAEISWTPQTLAAYLTDPQKTIPGNRMPFPGLKSEHDRDDVIAFLVQAAGGAPATASGAPPATPPQPPTPAGNQPAAAVSPPAASHGMPDMPDVKYTLRSGIAEGRMVFLGVAGAIDGQINPVLSAAEGQIVQVTLINGEGAEHDVVFPDQKTQSLRVTGKGASTTIAFRAEQAGDYLYFCSVPGHRPAGMEGKFIVTPKPPAEIVAYADVSREATDLPGPIGKRAPQTIRVDLVAVELEGRLAEATTFGYWTFNGKVPGPFLRVRVGDRVEVHMKNSADSSMVHSVDFHAATGPGGGAAVLQVNPGDEKMMTFKALVPGLYVYHCATPMVAEHIANGMYGLILVEPEDGLEPVDHEFYVMQGEIYTDAAFGQHGSQEFSVEKLLAERPEYFVFNGAVGALTRLHPLHANVGESVRIFFGVGGPNLHSAFHVIGEIFDKAYNLGGVLSPPLRGVQTVTVPPGGAAITEFTPQVPGNYLIVDHALARVERGLAGTLIVGGNPNPEIYTPAPGAPAGTGH
jgi:nitrite reductase (NO-forming)